MDVRVVKRRNVLQLFAAGVVGAAVPTGQAAENERSWRIELSQGDSYVELEPLSGENPVEDFYGYAYPVDEYGGGLGVDGASYSSEGTVDLQRDGTSVLFLYEGPDGLSLVVVHGRLYDGDGGAVTFTIHGLPEDGEWIVMDDYLLDAGGDEVSEDWWDVDDDPHVIDWMCEPGETDGGVFWPLEDDFEIRLEPAFNDEAYFADDCDCGPIERWEVLSGDLSDPDRYSLKLDRGLIVRGVKDAKDLEKKPVKKGTMEKRPKKKQVEKETVRKKPEKEKPRKKPEKKTVKKEKVRKPEKDKPQEVTKKKPEKERKPKKVEKKPKKKKPVQETREKPKRKVEKKPEKKEPEKPERDKKGAETAREKEATDERGAEKARERPKGAERP